MDDLVSRQAVLSLTKEIVVDTKNGETYCHRSIDPSEVIELPYLKMPERVSITEAEIYMAEHKLSQGCSDWLEEHDSDGKGIAYLQGLWDMTIAVLDLINKKEKEAQK